MDEIDRTSHSMLAFFRALTRERLETGQSFDVALASMAAEPQLQELASRVRRVPGFEAKFSVKFLFRRLRDFFGALDTRSSHASVLADARRFVEELKRMEVRKLCIVPLFGVSIRDGTLNVGPFTLRTGNTREIERLEELQSGMLARNPRFAREMSDNLREWLGGSTIAEIEIRADPYLAEELLERRTHQLVDLLQFAAHFFEFMGVPRVSLVRGDTRLLHSWILPLDECGYLQPNRRLDLGGDLILDEQGFKKLGEIGVLSIAESIGRVGTQEETAVMDAIHWFAEAQRQDHYGSRYVCLTIALECLCRRSGVHRLAEFVALLVGKPEGRARIYNDVRNLLEIRNRVVHEGFRPATDPVDIREYVGCAIGVSMAAMRSGRSFREVVEARRWSTAE